MNLLDRYVFRQAAGTSLAAVGIFGAVLILGNALRELAGYFAQGQLPLETFLQLLALLVPFVVTYALPLGVLAGTLLVLGRLSAQHEITAMRSAGIGLPRIAAPILVFAALGVGVSVLVNFRYGPEARGIYRQLLASAVKANPPSFLVPKTFIRDFPGYVIYVTERRGEELRDLWIWELDAARRVTKLVRAEAGRFEFDEHRAALFLRLRAATAELRAGRDPEDFSDFHPAITLGEAEIVLPLDRVFGGDALRKSPAWMTYEELTAERARREARWRETGDPQAEREWMRVNMLLQERLAFAFAVMSFALVAIPLGFRFRRKETSANLALAVVLALTYFLLMIFIGWLDKVPALRPDLLLWLPNAAFHAAGAYLIWNAGRR